jgi:hypothetical protein
MFSDVLEKISEYNYDDPCMKQLAQDVSSAAKRNDREPPRNYDESVDDQFAQEMMHFDPAAFSESTRSLSRYADSSITSSAKGDHPRVRSNATSDMRIRIARHEPVRSKYYMEHVRRFKKPPFVRAPRVLAAPNDTYTSKRSS